MKQSLMQTAEDVKVAGTVAGGSTLTGAFDLFQGGVSVIAVAAGACLSITLIAIHLMRWRNEKREADLRYELLRNEKDTIDKAKKEQSEWPYRQD